MSSALNPELPDRTNKTVEEIVDSVIRGDGNSEDIATLRERLRSDPAALSEYLDQIRIHALLEWRTGRVSREPLTDGRSQSPSLVNGEDRYLWKRRRIWAVAASVVIVATIAASILWRSRSTPRLAVVDSPFADVTEVRGVEWDDGQVPCAVGGKVGSGEIGIQSGTLRLHSYADVDIALAGPARVRFLTASRLAVHSGRVTARVGPAGKGFVVEAPGGDVIDLGTEFGVEVGSKGDTSVVVFEGTVDLKTKAVPTTPQATTHPDNAGKLTRLTQGQAVRIRDGGVITRVAAVNRQLGAADWSLDERFPLSPGAVIASVRDNIRDPQSKKFYQIVRNGLSEDARAYVDRSHEWNGVDARGIPPELLGADLLMTFNDDKAAYDLELSLTLARSAAVYVFFKPRGPDVPDWLRRDFKDTGLTIGLDEGPPDLPNSTLAKGAGNSIDRVFHVWRREVMSPGTITLGPNLPRNGSMYGVAAVALPVQP